ncbi:MAG: hypothetical protein CMJ85_07305 [Planctomycetes bacterium]|jgi:hypothetical protein|nr:hypothetical protein [Planctomycetota bacterium]
MSQKRFEEKGSFRRQQACILEKLRSGELLESDASWNWLWNAQSREESLLEHIGLYASGSAELPIFRAQDHRTRRPFIFSMVDGLLLELLQSPLEHYLWRSLRAALNYGLHGYSRGGRNGVFRQQPADGKMIRATWKLAQDQRVQVECDLGMGMDDERGALTAVKIVSHNPGGERYVGLLRNFGPEALAQGMPEHTRGIFLGLASY